MILRRVMAFARAAAPGPLAAALIREQSRAPSPARLVADGKAARNSARFDRMKASRHKRSLCPRFSS
jgi:hypothetical protein